MGEEGTVFPPADKVVLYSFIPGQIHLNKNVK